MTSYSDDFVAGVNEAIGYGQQLRIKYYTQSFGAGSYYDDDITVTQSGNDLWISGVILPINQSRGSNDAVLVEQGKVLTNDSKLYIKGSVNTSGIIKIGLGSYTTMTNEYSVLGEGIINYSVNEVDILKKVYIRRLTTGSLIGE